MKIIDKRGEVNFSQWMKMAKGHNGLSWWGRKNVRGQCIHCSNIFLDMSKCLCMTQSCLWRWNRIWCHFWRSLGNHHMCSNHMFLL
jgi:hypothetical protein